jgi:polyribonucleotide nucleotidyltransferase
MDKKFELNLGGRALKMTVRNLAEQSNGSVFLQYGDTMVLATAVMADHEIEGRDFFPLTVNYEEKFYAAGKIRGARYVKREGRPSDEAICNARLIDRSIRPLFPDNLKREIQIVVTVLSWDNQNEPDVVGLLASSIALSISDIPWNGPLAAVRVGRIDGKYIINPTYDEQEKSDVDIVFSAVERNGEIMLNMIEGGFEEVNEQAVWEAWEFARAYLKDLMNFEKEIIGSIAKEKSTFAEPAKNQELESKVKGILKDKLEDAFFQAGKEKMQALRDEIMNFAEENYPEEKGEALKILEKETEQLMQRKVMEEGVRPDGRKIDEIRKLSCDVGLLPRTHGSGLFCRGLTKSLSILTLGAPGDVQLLEGMEIVGKKRFMHHYNFPPYSVGEARPIRGPGRREIGHGMLAEKAVLPVIPSSEDFPYTIRIVSEILSSNGSTSMASICSSSLALMDAGVPIKEPVAGIAIGLVTDGKDYKLLTDIQGPEDHYGKMDFKVAGTREGITAIQMDIKVEGVPETILKEALELGKKARFQILDTIKGVLDKPRPELSPYAPRILVLNIDPEKIGKVIGPGGKMINEIIDECGVSIDIEETGEVFITAEKEDAAKKAASWIKNIVREIKVGEVFQGKIKRILDFGAFAELVPGQEGMIHISKLAPYRVRKVEDVVKVGDIVPVKVIGIDEQGRIDLSLIYKESNSKKPQHGRRRTRRKRKR